ncbi:MAG: LVIVD repeat-containing protein [Bacteroidota bacterium]
MNIHLILFNMKKQYNSPGIKYRVVNTMFVFFLIISFACNTNSQNSFSGNVKNLSVLKGLGIGPCADVAIDKNNLYVIGGGCIYSFDISSPKNPILLDKLDGLGNVRQIEVQNGYAYVTSREEGLFIINVTIPNKMAKAAHYDTLELGTGIAVSGSLAAVANRQYGIELIDVSEPDVPYFLGQVRTGEAQSVFIHDSLTFVGDWAPREIVICKISDPQQPRIISTIKLEGYGDGVFVKDNLCFAATGHHSKTISPHDKDSEFFGRGHGLEIIDISDPYSPQKISVVKFPYVFFQRYIDMWDVQVSGDYAFVGNTEAGLFVVNISDPSNPIIVGHAILPEVDMPEDFMQSIFIKGEKSGPVGGFAIGNDVIYVAGKLDDLYIIDAKGLAKKMIEKKPKGKSYSDTKNEVPESPSVYMPNGQVHSVFINENNGKALVAAGEGGVHEVQLRPKLEGKQILNTKSIVFDVYFEEDRLFLAEGGNGLSIWDFSDKNIPKLLGRYKSSKGGVYQSIIDTKNAYAFLHVGANTLEFVDISNMQCIELIGSDQQAGNFYRLPLAQGILNGRFIACSWHQPGAFLYEIGEDGIQSMGKVTPALGVTNGVAFENDKLLAVYRNGYILQNVPDESQLEIKDPIIIQDKKIQGKPTIFNSRMYVSNRLNGAVTSVDISDLKSPEQVWHLQVKGNPGLIKEDQDMVIIPAGRGGLQLYNKSNGSPFYGN